MAGGRPTKYKPEYCKQATKLCKLGATTTELADFFEVATSTIELWAVIHPAFSGALKLGKAVSDERVERSLYHKAIGYSHEEDVIKVVDNEIVTVPTVKHYPPDTTACIYWTKNRRPGKWRSNDRDEDEAKDKQNITINLVDAVKPIKE